MKVNIEVAKATLSKLLDKALDGEEVVIARAGKPLVRLTPFASADSNSGVRLGGLKRSRVKLAPDFHAPLTDDDLIGGEASARRALPVT